MSQFFDVIIIGAGAAGLFCAIEAAKRGRHVLLCDHANKPGKKILMSGGGRCNFTNIHTTPENFISHNPHFCKSALSRYTPWHFVEMVQRHGISFHEKTLGQLFCDQKSQAILGMLLAECEAAGVRVQMHTSIDKITKDEASQQFTLKTNVGDYQCESCVIATGGLSIPTMGATPFGYRVAEQFGLRVYPTRAGLVPLTLHDSDKEIFSALSGVAWDSIVSTENVTFRESMLITHRGLSGPAILQISSYWQPGMAISINCHPETDLEADLVTQQKQTPEGRLKTYLQQQLPKRLLPLLVSNTLLETPLKSLTMMEIRQIANNLHAWQIKPNGTEGYRTAEVTLGGVSCDDLSSKTMQANNVPGLYFIGEVVDVTGWLGGYNFQWAWSSAWAAGQVI